MLRATQMLLAEGLRRHDGEQEREEGGEQRGEGGRDFEDAVITAFADCPGAPFGLHELCRAGLSHDKFPGEWFGPTAACLVRARKVRQRGGGRREVSPLAAFFFFFSSFFTALSGVFTAVKSFRIHSENKLLENNFRNPSCVFSE